MFAAAREVARMDREVRAGVWTPQEGVQLHGKTLGVIGLGGIGREVAHLGRGLGMHVLGWNRTRRAGVPLSELDTLLHRADVVSINLTNCSGSATISARNRTTISPSVTLPRSCKPPSSLRK